MESGAQHTYVGTYVHADVSIAHQDAVLSVAALLKDLLVDEGRLCRAAVAHMPAIRQRNLILS